MKAGTFDRRPHPRSRASLGFAIFGFVIALLAGLNLAAASAGMVDRGHASALPAKANAT